jgi:ribulose-phosphate 3-epimerase
MKYIAPSVLSADFADIRTGVKMVENAGILHLDCMDGNFVPNISFGPKMVADIRKITDMFLDVHLMIDRPERYVAKFLSSGADLLTIHVEATQKTAEILTEILSSGKKSGLSISPDTPTEAIAPFLHMCDVILVMSVYPGFGGQKFLEGSLERVKSVQRMISQSGSKAVIEVDGGITEENILALSDCGVSIFVAGNTVYGAENPSEMVSKLQKMVNKHD